LNNKRNSFLSRAVRTLRTEIRFYQHLLAHSKTPRLAKYCLYIGLAYLLSPFDLIPDFVPILGQLDDLLIVGGLIWLATRLTPAEIIKECRNSSAAPPRNDD